MAGERLPASFSLRSQLWYRWKGKYFETATSHMQTVMGNYESTLRSEQAEQDHKLKWQNLNFIKMKTIILMATMLLTFSFSNAQTVRSKDSYGNKIAYVDGNTLRSKDSYGDKLFYKDGNTIRRKDSYGDKVYYLDGNTVRYKDSYGDKVYYFDGNTIRSKDSYGDKLYYLDGNTLRYKDSYGDKAYYFEGIPEKWVIICLIGL